MTPASATVRGALHGMCVPASPHLLAASVSCVCAPQAFWHQLGLHGQSAWPLCLPCLWLGSSSEFHCPLQCQACLWLGLGLRPLSASPSRCHRCMCQCMCAEARLSVEQSHELHFRISMRWGPKTCCKVETRWLIGAGCDFRLLNVSPRLWGSARPWRPGSQISPVMCCPLNGSTGTPTLTAWLHCKH